MAGEKKSRDNTQTGAADAPPRARGVAERTHEAELHALRLENETLRRRLAEYDDFFENGAVGLHSVGSDGILLRANRAELQMLGYERDEYIGHHISEFHNSGPVIDDILERLKRGETLHNVEARLRCKDGSIRDVLISSSVYHDNGRFVHSRCFTRDITLRKRTEEALRQSLERFDLMVRGSKQGLWDAEVRADDPFHPQNPVYYSSRFKQIMGCDENDFPNLLASWTERLHPDDRERVFAALSDHMWRRVPYEVEYRIITPAGEVRWIEARGEGLWDADGKPVRLSGSVADVTARKQAEQALSESERRLRAVIVAAPVMLLAIDSSGLVTVAEGRCLEALGLMPWARGRASIYDVGTHRPEMLACFDRALAGKSFSVSMEVGAVVLECQFAPVCDDAEVLCGALCVATDVTDRKLAERQAQLHLAELAHMSRLTTMGEMAAQIAHEINQPLAAIANFTNGCLRRLRGSDCVPGEIVDVMEQAAQQAERAGEIIKRVRRLVRRREPTRAAVDLNQRIRFVAALFADEAAQRRVEVELNLAEGLPTAPADPLQVEQVLVNLIKNALEAMGDAAEPRRLKVTTHSDDGRVIVAAEDTGPGVTDEALARMFEPFVSSKPHGLGMGLAIARSIIESHGGRLDAHRAPGGGMRFQFELPGTVKSAADDVTPNNNDAATARVAATENTTE